MNRTAALLALALLPHLLFAAETKLTATLPIGASAPDFKLPGVDGKKYSLKDFKSSPVLVVVFTCVHCPTAQYYEDRLIKLVEDYKEKGVSLVAISPNDPRSVRFDELGYTDLGDSYDEMKMRAAHKVFNFPFLYDGDTEEASRAYGPVATPHAFVFDKARKLRYVGRIDDDERGTSIQSHDLRHALDALLAGRAVPVPQTPAFGCSVKWAGKEGAVALYHAKLALEPVNVELIDPDGLRALRTNDSGKLRLVNFWATWCGPCITEMPDFIEINRMYRQRAFELVLVAANYPDERKEVLAFLKRNQCSTTNYLFNTKTGDNAPSGKYKLIEAFDKEWNGALPYTVLISPAGEILYKESGPIDPLELKRTIVKALKEDRFK